MASNSSSCPTPGGGHLNGYPVPPYAFFFPHMLGGLSPPSTLAGIQHQLPVSGYSTPSPASEYRGTVGGGCGTPGTGVGVRGDPSVPGSVPSVGHRCHPQAAVPALVCKRPQGGGTGEGGGLPAASHLIATRGDLGLGGIGSLSSGKRALGASPHVSPLVVPLGKLRHERAVAPGEVCVS